MEPHSITEAQLLGQFTADIKNGLSSTEAQSRLLRYGLNNIKEYRGKNPFLLFASQFKNYLVLILLLAALASFLLGENVDTIMIMVIVLLNGAIGFIQEYRVEKTVQQLKKLVSSNSLVYRDGKLTEIPSINLVPGDIIVLEEGQKIPADIRVLTSNNLEAVEAPLTGESTPVFKNPAVLPKYTEVADQKNMVFSGTTISSGRGIGLVISTGTKTQLGKIANLVIKEPESKTPMQVKLDQLGSWICKLILAVALIVGVEQMLFGENPFKALLSASALAVASIPEGLPAIVTISLALGAGRLFKKRALLRNLASAETLGSTDIICTDKTGTLTQGNMEVAQLFTTGKLPPQELVKFGILSSNARRNGEDFIGEPTEVAIIRRAEKLGINQDEVIESYIRMDETPFSSERKMMTTVNKSEGEFLITSKGAIEAIMKVCPNLTQKEKDLISKTHDKMANSGLRVLALAYKKTKSKPTAEKELIFAGLIGFIDPPKSGVKESIAVCRSAGIRVIMITGDHILTAQNIAAQIGIEGESISGEDLNKLSDDEFARIVENIGVYARVNPEHKIKIIKALKVNGHQVAMTGDGVNDAPALKAADIGIAMGETGTDVAKDSSDMILLDDNFTTIVHSIREGRSIYENIRKFVNYLLTSNLMEVIVIFIAVLLGWPLPLLPIHLIWINLVTDGLPALALGVDPARHNIMSSPPNKFREEIINRRFLRNLIVVSIILSSTTLGLFGFYKEDVMYAQSLAFTAVVIYELIRIFAIRAEYHLNFFSNKYLLFAMTISMGLQVTVLYLPLNIFGSSLQSLFKIQALNIKEWVILLLTSLALLALMKLFIRPRSFGLPAKA